MSILSVFCSVVFLSLSHCVRRRKVAACSFLRNILYLSARCVMWTAARIPKATSQIKEFPAAAFYFPLSERLNTDAGRLSRLANAHLPTCHARLHFHLITRRRLFSSHSDDFLRVQTSSIFHFLRALHTRRNCMCAAASGLSLCVCMRSRGARMSHCGNISPR